MTQSLHDQGYQKGPGDFGHLENRVRRARDIAMVRAALVLQWERIWPRLWPLAAIIAATLGVFLTDVLPALPVWLHGSLLVGAVLAAAWAARYAVTDYTPPDKDEILHRIDRDSGLRHDPLSVLDDNVDTATSTPQSQVIWAAHRTRTLASIKSLRVAWPAPCLARHDPIGFRALAFLILVIGLVAGAGDAQNRIARALTPGLGGDLAENVKIDIWVTPPDYTGLAPFYLTNNTEGVAGSPATDPTGPQSDGDQQFRDVPVGSRVIAQVGIPDDTAELGLELYFGSQRNPFEVLGAGGYRADLTLEEDFGEVGMTRLSVRRGDAELAGWTVRAIDDRPPEIFYVQPPASGNNGQLRVVYGAEDDFGISKASLVLRNPAFAPGDPGGEPDRMNLPLPRARAMSIETAIVRNTSSHDWAGLPVELQLEAVDVNGAIGLSEPFAMILPERIFNHPIARALAEYRKALVQPDGDTVQRVLHGLDQVSRSPQMFGDAISVFLGVRVARARLAYDHDGTQIPSIREMLWRMALRLEEGEFAIAGRELMDAQNRLMEALREGTFDEQTNSLLDQLEQALDRYLEALAERLREDGMEGLGDIPGMEHFEAKDLQQMIEDARELARTGAMDAAEQTLEQLAQMLQAMQNAMSMGQSGQEQLNAARRMLEQLSNMSRQQQDLLDQTYRELRRMQGLEGGLGEQAPNGDVPGKPNAGAGGAGQWEQPHDAARRLAGPQDSLKQELSELMTGLSELLGGLPPTIGDAERAMGRATDSLRLGDPSRAVPSQSDALDLLRQTTEGMIQMMTQQLRGQSGNQLQMQGNRARDGSDPFGRVGGGALGTQMDDGGVTVPDRGDIMRSRRIFDELRRRAGERYRPMFELDYIERLLKPF
ncbi:MAG: TIGR02302 family protein [Rhodospirillales bacterium]